MRAISPETGPARLHHSHDAGPGPPGPGPAWERQETHRQTDDYVWTPLPSSPGVPVLRCSRWPGG